MITVAISLTSNQRGEWWGKEPQNRVERGLLFPSLAQRGLLFPRPAQSGLLFLRLAQIGLSVPRSAQRGLLFPSLAQRGLPFPSLAPRGLVSPSPTQRGLPFPSSAQGRLLILFIALRARRLKNAHPPSRSWLLRLRLGLLSTIRRLGAPLLRLRLVPPSLRLRQALCMDY